MYSNINNNYLRLRRIITLIAENISKTMFLAKESKCCVTRSGYFNFIFSPWIVANLPNCFQIPVIVFRSNRFTISEVSPISFMTIDDRAHENKERIFVN